MKQLGFMYIIVRLETILNLCAKSVFPRQFQKGNFKGWNWTLQWNCTLLALQLKRKQLPPFLPHRKKKSCLYCLFMFKKKLLVVKTDSLWCFKRFPWILHVLKYTFLKLKNGPLRNYKGPFFSSSTLPYFKPRGNWPNIQFYNFNSFAGIYLHFSLIP